MEVKAANTTISGGNINFNGPTATEAAPASKAALPSRLKLHKLSDESGEFVEDIIPPSIMRRVPTAEPYPYHENLDPLKVKSEETDRDLDNRYEDTDLEGDENVGYELDPDDLSETMLDPADAWKVYSLTQDTFLKGNN